MRASRPVRYLANFSEYSVNAQLNECASRNIENCLSEIALIPGDLNHVLALRNVTNLKTSSDILREETAMRTGGGILDWEC
jgi:hypothetical protein